MAHSLKTAFHWLKNFFINYIWIGIVLILLSITLDLHSPANTRSFSYSILINLMAAFGISILIAAIFSFASSTSEFINKIRGLLEDIIIRRNFLANIDPDGKKEALKALIQPSASEINKYPNIGDYYGHFINKTLSISKKSVRSNYQVVSRAYFDTQKESIAIEGVYSYRLYPCTDGFNDITIGFEDNNSFCSHVTVSDPNGERMTFDNPQLREHDEGGDISFRTTIEIKQFGDRKSHLDVELKVTEFGTDHWSLVQFKALQPTDGFKFYMYCEGDVVIREHAIFVVGAKYYFTLSENKKSVTVACNQWINEGSGLCVLVSIPHKQA